MIIDRRPYWFWGLGLGVAIVAFVWFAPKKTPEQRVRENVALLAREPWHKILVYRVDVHGPPQRPSDVFVYGARPDGSPVVVQFAADTPYTATRAIRRLTEQSLDNRSAEMVLIPRSLVHKQWKERFSPQATHAGIAVFAGIEGTADAEDAEHDMEGESMDAAPASSPPDHSDHSDPSDDHSDG